jgi:hypothetical protein
MRPLLPLLLAVIPLTADVEIRGHADLQADAFLIRPESKHDNDFTLLGNLEAEYAHEAFRAALQLNAQQDYYDLQGRNEHNGRSFVRLDELYGSYDFDEDRLSAGRSIRFWGALEVRNIVDGFNPVDFRSGLFEEDKMGVWNAAWTHYTDTGSLALIVKMHEEDRKMAQPPYVYYFFPPFARYDRTLNTETSRDRPTFYLRLSGSTETEYPLDYTVILQHGYDAQRYFLPDGPPDGSVPVTLGEHAYLVNKAMTFETLVVGETLFKLEALYTDVIDEERISDYYHVGIGVEHTLSQIHGNADLGLLAEYYRYDTLEKGEGKYTDLELFEVFQNDLFVGLRYSWNNMNDASLVGGVVSDMEYNEQSWYAEYETRLFDAFKLNADYRYIEPSKRTATAFHLLGRIQTVTVKLGYYF